MSNTRAANADRSPAAAGQPKHKHMPLRAAPRRTTVSPMATSVRNDEVFGITCERCS